MDARIDAEKYNFSCRKMENFIPRIYGGAFRRPGMVHLGSTYSGTSRLIPYNISADIRYMIEISNLKMRLWDTDGSLILDLVNSPFTNTLELTSPYTSAQMFDVKFVQLNNFIFFVHPDHPPYQMQRVFSPSFSTFTFTLAAVTFTYPVFRTQNQTAVTATPDGTTGSVDITFSENILDESAAYSDYVGMTIELVHRRDDAYVEIDLTSTTDSSAIKALGDYSLITYGTWDGTVTVQGKDDAGAWQDIRSFSAEEDRNVNYTATLEEATDVRISYVAASAGTGTPRAVLELSDSTFVGSATVDSVVISGGLPVLTCSVVNDLDSATATTEWSFEAFADYAGYPRSVAFHEQRLWFGGTELEPNTFWASATNDFLNFKRGAFDADALSFTLAAQEGSSIQSMLSHEALILFTQTEEWTATTTEQTVITPSNIFVRRQSRFGSAYLPSFIANNNILFLQRGGRKFREFVYSAAGGEGQSSDLSLLAEHITVGGIKQIAYQQQPDPVIWMVTNNGELISTTYESTQNVIAWSRHPTDGTVESVAVIYGSTNSSDEVWIVTNRENGRCIERLNPTANTLLENGTQTGMIYLDAAVVQASETPFTVVTGLDHLDGETVHVVADEIQVANAVPSSGSITLASSASSVVVGLPYTSILQPSKLEIALDDGTAQGRKFICKRITLNMYNTKGVEYADSYDAAEAGWFDAAEATPSDGSLFTGQTDVNNLGSHKENINISLRQKLPYPCNVLAIISKFDVLGN